MQHADAVQRGAEATVRAREQREVALRDRRAGRRLAFAEVVRQLGCIQDLGQTHNLVEVELAVDGLGFAPVWYRDVERMSSAQEPVVGRLGATSAGEGGNRGSTHHSHQERHPEPRTPMRPRLDAQPEPDRFHTGIIAKARGRDKVVGAPEVAPPAPVLLVDSGPPPPGGLWLHLI